MPPGAALGPHPFEHAARVGRRAGGLLGRHVEAASTGAELWVPREAVEWDERRLRLIVLPRGGPFLAYARRRDRPWRVLWCAGSGVVATPPAALADETAIVDGFSGKSAAGWRRRVLARSGAALPRLLRRRRVCGQPRSAPVRRDLGCSGRRSVWASEARPGGALHRGRRACGVNLLIGRLSNLYGPGQNLAKPQGLVAHVGDSVLRRQPISVYVPLDTIRDYLYASDAGRMVVEALERREQERRSGRSGKRSPRFRLRDRDECRFGARYVAAHPASAAPCRPGERPLRTAAAAHALFPIEDLAGAAPPTNTAPPRDRRGQAGPARATLACGARANVT